MKMPFVTPDHHLVCVNSHMCNCCMCVCYAGVYVCDLCVHVCVGCSIAFAQSPCEANHTRAQETKMALTHTHPCLCVCLCVCVWYMLACMYVTYVCVCTCALGGSCRNKK